ncbi:hypothetical protein GAY28_00400 [Azospirillum brasilense]|nr:hypothetical protein [Azospirillum brasilense]
MSAELAVTYGGRHLHLGARATHLSGEAQSAAREWLRAQCVEDAAVDAIIAKMIEVMHSNSPDPDLPNQIFSDNQKN